MIVRVPRALSRQMIERPTGPQPITIATVALPHVAAADRVPADRHRLGQRRHVGRQPVRHLERERLLDEERLRIGAGRLRESPSVWTPPPRRSSGSATTRAPSASRLRVFAPCAAIRPVNSWPKTTCWSERMKSS